jgi:CRISPR/Cas system-associated endonuclease Cas1
MTGDPISAQIVGEPGFSISSFFLRLLLALAIVLLTFNPGGFSIGREMPF